VAKDRTLIVGGWVMEALAAEALHDGAHAARARQEAATLLRSLGTLASTVNHQAGGDGWLSTETDALLTLSTLHLAAGNFNAARELAQRTHMQATAREDLAYTGRALVNLAWPNSAVAAAPPA
jgi:hypothetical protein